jgi:hypothetical protein
MATTLRSQISKCRARNSGPATGFVNVARGLLISVEFLVGSVEVAGIDPFAVIDRSFEKLGICHELLFFLERIERFVGDLRVLIEHTILVGLERKAFRADLRAWVEAPLPDHQPLAIAQDELTAPPPDTAPVMFSRLAASPAT